MAKRGQYARARRWAQTAEKAWRKFLARDKYYNAYVHLALALGVMGQLEEMEYALRAAARISGRAASYLEFRDIRERVRNIQRPR